MISEYIGFWVLWWFMRHRKWSRFFKLGIADLKGQRGVLIPPSPGRQMSCFYAFPIILLQCIYHLDYPQKCLPVHPHTFLSHENAKTSCWLHLFNLILMWRFFLVCFHMSIYPNFDLNFVPYFSQSRDFFTLSGFSSCTCLLCLMTCDLCALSYGHFSHLCFLSRFLTAGLNIVAQIQVWHYFRIGLYFV